MGSTTTEVRTFPKFSKDLLVLGEGSYGDWRDEFAKNGCVVIKNVISKEKAEYYCQKQIDWLKSFNLGFDDKDETTWTQDNLPIAFKGG